MVQTINVFVPSALKLYQFGISLLLDEDWIDQVLKHRIEKYLINGQPPKHILRKSLPNGLLIHIGHWVFEEYVLDASSIAFLEPEDQFRKLREWYSFILGNQLASSQSMIDLLLLVDDLGNLEDSVDIFESAFVEQHYNAEVSDVLENVMNYYEDDIKSLSHIYAANFAERVFHDRQMCEYISHSVAVLYDYQGLPEKERDEIEIKKISREVFPSWVKPTLLARERGRCAICGTAFNELECEPQIDHIIPLASGGFNDIVNLQMLCDTCNNKKSASMQLASSSIPEYLRWHRSMKKGTRNMPTDNTA